MTLSNEEDGKICPVCGGNCTVMHYEKCVVYNCENCGKYKMNNFGNEPRLTEHHKLILKHFYTVIPEEDPRRYSITLTNDNIDQVVESIDYPKTLVEKIDRALIYFVKKTTYLGERIEVKPETLSRILFCVNRIELSSIFETLKGYISADGFAHADNTFKVWVEAEGLRYYEANLRYNNTSKQGFVAMWFNNEAESERYRPDMQKVYSVAIKPAIEFGDRFTSIKIDNVEHCNDINDEMISQIRKSKFMIADLTGYRGGVYWEAGFAEGLGIPVIYTCHEKWLKSDDDLNIEGVHFDLNHRNIILWNEDKLEDFSTKLRDRINALIT